MPTSRNVAFVQISLAGVCSGLWHALVQTNGFYGVEEYMEELSFLAKPFNMVALGGSDGSPPLLGQAAAETVLSYIDVVQAHPEIKKYLKYLHKRFRNTSNLIRSEGERNTTQTFVFGTQTWLDKVIKPAKDSPKADRATGGALYNVLGKVLAYRTDPQEEGSHDRYFLVVLDALNLFAGNLPNELGQRECQNLDVALDDYGISRQISIFYMPVVARGGGGGGGRGGGGDGRRRGGDGGGDDGGRSGRGNGGSRRNYVGVPLSYA